MCQGVYLNKTVEDNLSLAPKKTLKVFIDLKPVLIHYNSYETKFTDEAKKS